MSSQNQKACVLVVDDDETIVDVVRIALGRLGYDIIISMEGDEAFELAQASQPDVILLDKKMPEMHGHDVLRQLKNEQNTKSIPVVMMTGTNDAIDVAESLKLGADDYIVKPFAMEELAKCLQRVLEGQRFISKSINSAATAGE